VLAACSTQPSAHFAQHAFVRFAKHGSAKLNFTQVYRLRKLNKFSRRLSKVCTNAKSSSLSSFVPHSTPSFVFSTPSEYEKTSLRYGSVLSAKAQRLAVTDIHTPMPSFVSLSTAVLSSTSLRYGLRIPPPAPRGCRHTPHTCAFVRFAKHGSAKLNFTQDFILFCVLMCAEVFILCLFLLKTREFLNRVQDDKLKSPVHSLNINIKQYVDN